MTDSTGSETSSTSPKILRLPLWALGTLVVLDLVSVLAAPGVFVKGVWLAMVVAGIVGVGRAARREIKSLIDSRAGGSFDSAAAKSALRGLMPVPLWAFGLLLAGLLWTVVLIIQIVGFLIGLLVVLACVAILAGVILVAYKAAKKRGLG